MNAVERAEAREYLIGLIDRALDSDELTISTPAGVREFTEEEYAAVGGSTSVMRKLTGERSLHLEWREGVAER